MFDSVNPLWRKQQSQWASRLDRFRFHFGKLVRLNPAEMWAYGRERSEAIIERIRRLAWRAAYKLRLQTDRRRNHQLRDLSEILSITASQYTPSQYSGRVAMVRPQVRPPGTRSDAAESWKNLLPHLDVIDVPGTTSICSASLTSKKWRADLTSFYNPLQRRARTCRPAPMILDRQDLAPATLNQRPTDRPSRRPLSSYRSFWCFTSFPTLSKTAQRTILIN